MPVGEEVYARKLEDADYRIIVLGTSISWGQGLLPTEKFAFLVTKHLVDSGVCAAPALKNYAHSGATLWDPVNLFDPALPAYPRTMTAAKTALATRKRKKKLVIEAEANRLDGEWPADQPYLWGQLIQANDDLRAANRQADLVLVDVGANDVDFLKQVMTPDRNPTQTRRAINLLSGEVCWFLQSLRSETWAFERAKIVLTSYYEAFTSSSNLHGARLDWFLTGLGTVIQWDRARMLSQAFCASFEALHDAEVTRANQILNLTGDRAIRFAPPDFGFDHGMFAPDSCVWGPDAHGNPQDHVIANRDAWCRAHGQLDLVGHRASFGHPSPRGARKMADAIIAKL
jgi:hypothetical protein